MEEWKRYWDENVGGREEGGREEGKERREEESKGRGMIEMGRGGREEYIGKKEGRGEEYWEGKGERKRRI